MKVKDFVCNSFGLDVRALSLFRIGLGLLVCVDLLQRATSLRDHYTDFGVLPRQDLLAHFLNPFAMCLHVVTGSYMGQVVLFGIHFVLGILMLIGFHTQLLVFCNWFMMTSLHLRNPMILQAGDDLLRMMLFWGIFLPLGSCWAVDQFYLSQQPSQQHSLKVCTPATAALFIQILLLYWINVALKTGETWRKDFSAVYYTLQLDQLALPLGVWLRQYYPLTQGLTFLVYSGELLLPWLLLIGGFWPFLRLLAIVGLILMHHGFALCLVLGLFPWIDTVSMLPFLSASVFATARKMQPESTQLKPWLIHRDVWVIGALSLVLADNICVASGGVYYLLPVSRAVVEGLRINQNWAVFAPNPLKEDGWFVFPGHLNDGRPTDARHQILGTVPLTKPKLVSADYGDQRWIKYFLNLRLSQNKQHLLLYARYLCRRYNGLDSKPKPDSLATFQIVFMQELTPAFGTQAPTPVPITLWSHHCFSG